MRKIFALLLVLVLASCGEHNRLQTSQASHPTQRAKTPPAPPPLPPLPGSSFKPIPETQALAAAKQMGPGDCGDLQKIQGLPLKGQHGFDPYYDRIIVHIDSYEQCLLQATSSAATTPVVASYPGVQISSVGDLAFILLVDGGKVSWGECTPADVVEQEKQKGAFAFYTWLNQPGIRKRWHDCLVHGHGT